MTKMIDYHKLLKEGAVYVVKKIFEYVSSDGLSDKQQLYVTFSLKHPDVKISQLLKADYDDEMTFVLQYEFWDLIVDDFGFSVSLAFEHSDETLYVPFSSLIAVSDPSEDFNLEFDPDLSIRKPKSPENKKLNNESNIISLDDFRKK